MRREGKVCFEYVVLPVTRGDVKAFNYEWHYANHDPGDEDRSER